MNEPKKTQFVGTGQTNNRSGITPPNHEELKVITGTLTSRVKTRQDYHYGFFKSGNLVDPEAEFPVIFKIKTCRLHEECQKCPWGGETNIKPNILVGSVVELTGTWSSGKDRPSFTCSDYKLLKEPEPPTLASLQKEISALLRPSLDKKKEWAETTDFLFRKQKDLQEIEKISKLGNQYLQAYLLTKQVFYANYQEEHLPLADFDLPSYLARIASELVIVKRQMLATGWREVK